jgi:hypothetical protein
MSYRHGKQLTGWSVLIAAITLSGCGADAVPSNEIAQHERAELASRMQSSIEKCKADLSAPELDPIRQKADPLRTAADGAPPPALASNDAFPSESEPAVIAKWIKIRDVCMDRFTELLVVPPSVDTFEATALRETFTLSKLSQSGVGDLIIALYQQKMAYGEFARKRYELTREAAEINSALNKAVMERDRQQLERAQQRLANVSARWEADIREIRSRSSRSVNADRGRGPAVR